jgi:pyruvate dehydrogenase E2 component (dihydrolipoamide acetyltransferase)
MPTPFIMPKFDMDQETATIVSWLKHDGDLVRQDEAVLVVETDKVAIDVLAPVTGTLWGACAKEGEVVPVTTTIAYILGEGETPEMIPQPPGTEVARAVGPESLSSQTGLKVTPLAERMAKHLGIDLSRVPARRGRISKADVERYVRATPPGDGKIPATPAARRLAREQGIGLAGVRGSGPGGRIQAADVRSSGAKSFRASTPRVREADIIPLAGIRRTIAERMQASFRDAPHIALTVDADVTALEAARRSMNEALEYQAAAKVTLTALLVHVVARTLKHHPYLNASLIEGAIHLWRDINVGVATVTPNGLIVPVIRNADLLSIRQTNDLLQDLTARARDGRLELHEVQDGTFTVSNLGMFGIREFRAVINPPESAILAVGAVQRRPVATDDTNEITVRPIMSLTLSADHRVLDGVVAANFLTDLVRGIEIPDPLAS